MAGSGQRGCLHLSVLSHASKQLIGMMPLNEEAEQSHESPVVSDLIQSIICRDVVLPVLPHRSVLTLSVESEYGRTTPPFSFLFVPAKGSLKAP